MNFSGPGVWPAILIALLFAGTGWLVFGIVRSAGKGMIQRNGAVGLRLRRIMMSEDTWRRAHLAATPMAKTTALLVSGFSLASIFGSASGLIYLILLGLMIVTLIGGLALSTCRAVSGLGRR